MAVDNEIIEQLAPTGTLRVGLNMANFLLITGRNADQEPDGVSPDVARRIAAELGVGIQFIEYKGPGELADDALGNIWDIGNIAAEAARAQVMSFSPAYCEIQATYLLPGDSPIANINDVDKKGNRIAVKGRSAYDLFLSEHIKNATLVRTESIDGSFEAFRDDKLEVLAGLRPALLKQQILMPGATLLDQSFTAVQQSVGCQLNKPAAAQFLTEFVTRSITEGHIEQSIDKHGVTGKLSVAPLPTNS